MKPTAGPRGVKAQRVITTPKLDCSKGKTKVGKATKSSRTPPVKIGINSYFTPGAPITVVSQQNQPISRVDPEGHPDRPNKIQTAAGPRDVEAQKVTTTQKDPRSKGKVGVAKEKKGRGTSPVVKNGITSYFTTGAPNRQPTGIPLIAKQPNQSSRGTDPEGHPDTNNSTLPSERKPSNGKGQKKGKGHCEDDLFIP
jgi:hypothetical protein